MRNEVIHTIPKQKLSWWNSLTEKQRNTIVSFAIILGVSVTGLIAVKFASTKLRGAIANGTQSGSFGENEHSTWAKRLKMAFDNDGWWGTDEQAVRKVLLEVPSKTDFQKIIVQYRRLYHGNNLIEDLTDELKTTEYNEMLAILNSKPDKKGSSSEAVIYDPNGWATRLYNAMSIYYAGIFPGTDEEAIKAVFQEIKTQEAFKETSRVYQNQYGTDLSEDLDGDLDWSLDWKAIIDKKPMK